MDYLSGKGHCQGKDFYVLMRRRLLTGCGGTADQHTQVYDHQKVEQDETSYVNAAPFWKETRSQKVINRHGDRGRRGRGGDGETQEITTTETVLNYERVPELSLREEKRFYEWALSFVSFRWTPKRKVLGQAGGEGHYCRTGKRTGFRYSLLSAYMAGLPDEIYKPEHIDENDRKVR